MNQTIWRNLLHFMTIWAFVLGCDNSLEVEVEFDSNKVKTTVESRVNVETGVVKTVSDLEIKPSMICKGLEFNNRNGQKVLGSRICDHPVSSKICEKDGDTNCLALKDKFVALNLDQFSDDNLKTDIEILDLVGSFSGFDQICDKNVMENCIVADPYVGIDISNLTSDHILAGVQIAGILGELNLSPADCVVPGVSQCISNDKFRAGKIEGLNLKIKKGKSVAGIEGSYAPDFPEKQNVKATDTVNGISGFIDNCTANGETSCTTTASYKSADISNVSVGNIKIGIEIAGITGTFIGAVVLFCTVDGQKDCMTTDSFKASDTSLLNASNIKKGITIASVGGDYPSTSNKLTGAGTSTGLTNSNFNSSVTSNGNLEFWNESGDRQQVSGEGNLIPANIKSGITLFGIGGTLTEKPDDCSSNAEVGCVATVTFKAGDLTNLSAGNIKSGITLAGQAGDYPSATYKLPSSGAETGLIDSNFNSLVTGSGNFEYWDEEGNRHQNTGDDDIVVAKLRNSISMFGVTGSTAEAPSDCSSNAEVGCVTTATYKAGDLTNLNAGTVKNGISLAGVTGDYPSVTYPLPGASGTSDLTNGTFDAKIASDTSFEYWDEEGTRHASSGDSDLIATNIKSGNTAFGVAGSLVEAPSDCSSNAEVGCVTTATYKAGDLTNLSAGNIKNGTALAGVTGDFPSATYPLSGATGTADLTSGTFDANMASATAFEYWDSAGTRQQSNGDADLVATNLKTGNTAFGVVGSLDEAPAVCSSNAEVGCVATVTFKAGDLTNLSAGNIKNGITLAGQAGDYPSATYKLPSAGGAAGLTNGTFEAKVKNNTEFEYWDEEGTRHTSSGDSDVLAANIKTGKTIFSEVGTIYDSAGIDSYDVRYGVTIGSITGDMKVNCQNLARTARYDKTSLPGSSGLDIFDGLDDYGNGTAATENDWGSAGQACGAELWEDVSTLSNGSTSTVCDTSSDHCMYQDKISKMVWSELISTSSSFNNANSGCNSLNFGGQTDWRNPTLKEAAAAYNHGLIFVMSSNFIPDTGGSNYFWTSSNSLAGPNGAWEWYPSLGYYTTADKSDLKDYVCIRMGN